MSARNFSMMDCTAEAWGRTRAVARKHGNDAALLWVWLQHNHYSHPSGLYQFHPFMATGATGMDEAAIRELVFLFSADGLLSFDPECHLVYIPSVLPVQGRGILKSTNKQRVGWCHHLDALPSHSFVDAVRDAADLPPVSGKISRVQESKGTAKTRASRGAYEGAYEGASDEGSETNLGVAS